MYRGRVPAGRARVGHVLSPRPSFRWLSVGFVRADVRGRCASTRAAREADVRADERATGRGWGGAPAASGDLGDGAVGGVLVEPLVDPCASHSGDLDEDGDGDAFGRGLVESGHEGLLGVGVGGSDGFVVHRAVDGIGRQAVEARTMAGVLTSDGAYAFGGVVAGCGDEELAGGVEGVGVPVGGVGALSEDEIGIPAFSDAQADAYVHLRTDRALAHGVLGGSLGRGEQSDGEQSDGDGAASASDRVGGGDGFGCLAALGFGRGPGAVR
ncbi:MAG: hypothetical protein JWN00_1626 [Actinomycetia bacterium]|nr:hypothetical protein [Actinomycetes bacterium]